MGLNCRKIHGRVSTKCPEQWCGCKQQESKTGGLQREGQSKGEDAMGPWVCLGLRSEKQACLGCEEPSFPSQGWYLGHARWTVSWKKEGWEGSQVENQQRGHNRHFQDKIYRTWGSLRTLLTGILKGTTKVELRTRFLGQLQATAPPPHHPHSNSVHSPVRYCPLAFMCFSWD